jgi:hypothetical protein
MISTKHVLRQSIQLAALEADFCAILFHGVIGALKRHKDYLVVRAVNNNPVMK